MMLSCIDRSGGIQVGVEIYSGNAEEASICAGQSQLPTSVPIAVYARFRNPAFA